MEVFRIYLNIKESGFTGVVRGVGWRSNPTQALGTAVLALQHPTPPLAAQGAGWEGYTGEGETGPGIMVRMFEN